MEPVRHPLYLYIAIGFLAYVLGRWFSKYYKPFFHIAAAAAFLIAVFDVINGISIREMIHDGIDFLNMLAKQLVHLATDAGFVIFVFIFFVVFWRYRRKKRPSGWSTRSESVPFH